MRNYETVLVLDEALGQDEIDALVSELTELVAKHGATETTAVPWGRKRLAYLIKKCRHAHFVVFQFTCPASCPAELERLVRIDKRVLRFQTYTASGEVDPEAIHYKNYEKLAGYITDRGKIRPLRTTRCDAAGQRNLATQIKRARNLGLLPFSTVSS